MTKREVQCDNIKQFVFCLREVLNRWLMQLL